jgi:hypothetical protein
MSNEQRPQLHIVGLDHFLQNLDAKCVTAAGKVEEITQKNKLAEFLNGIIQSNQVHLVAEEGKLDQPCLGSVLARQNGADHIDITMPISERERHGIRTPDYDWTDATRKGAYQVFERYMFERVREKHDGDTAALVMVGRRHLPGLTTLFRAAGCWVKAYDINDCGWYLGVPEEDADGVLGHLREE